MVTPEQPVGDLARSHLPVYARYWLLSPSPNLDTGSLALRAGCAVSVLCHRPPLAAVQYESDICNRRAGSSALTTGCRLARAALLLPCPRSSRCHASRFGVHSSSHINRTACCSGGLTALFAAACSPSCPFQASGCFRLGRALQTTTYPAEREYHPTP